jgi:hypothetical protein
MKVLKSKTGILFLFLFVMEVGCEKSNEYEEILLEHTSCSCEQATFIKEVEIKDVLLFDATKTSFSEMRHVSLNGKEAEFISYSPETDSTIYYNFKNVDAAYFNSIGYICNFPSSAKTWKIPSDGIYISFSADVFEACYGYPSVGFTQTYTDNILTSLKRKVK